MAAQSRQEGIDAFEETIVDYSLIFQGLDLMSSVVALLVDLILFRSDEGAFVDVRVDFDVGVVGELEGVPSERVSMAGE